MELEEILRLRPVAAAGTFVMLTGRCPLHCAHCSTASTVRSPQLAAGSARRFLGTYTRADRPEVTFFTGGEPLLRPRLLAETAAAVRRAGGVSAVLTGAFFARSERVPTTILRCLEGLDHVSVSLDPFHEREVPRSSVLALLRLLRERGVAVSAHVTAPLRDGGYVASVLADLRRVPGGGVPALVGRLAPVGRAAAWAGPGLDTAGSLPCAMATWPVVGVDGLVTACCNPSVVDARPVPPHLLLGDIAVDGWPSIRERTLAAPVLRAIRVGGPDRLRATATAPTGCAGCRGLSDSGDVVAAAERIARGRAGAAADALIARLQADAGPAALLRRYGAGRSVLR